MHVGVAIAAMLVYTRRQPRKRSPAFLLDLPLPLTIPFPRGSHGNLRSACSVGLLGSQLSKGHRAALGIACPLTLQAGRHSMPLKGSPECLNPFNGEEIGL